MWVYNVYRQLFAFINQGVGWCVEIVYGLLIQIADVAVFSGDVVVAFGNRIKVILGLIMLFKVVFSLVTYAINPDTITDKSKGSGKLITNIVIVLALLVSSDFLFKQAFELQHIVLDNALIPKIVFGNNVKSENSTYNSDIIKNAGTEMSFYVFTPFLRINPLVIENGTCDVIYGTTAGSQSEDDFKKKLQECQEKIRDLAGVYSANKIFEAIGSHKASLLFDSDVINIQKGNDYLFDFNALLSTACGIVVLLVLLNFTIDIAVRAVKISFLQLIAPVPIISYIDPKSNGMFKKWTSECFKTYADVFIRLIAIFFAIFVISAVANNRMVLISTGEQIGWDNKGYLQVAIIIGALLFAKQFPKLISDLVPGAKLDGKFSLNPMKKMSEVPVVGKTLSAGIGGVDSALHGNGFAAGVKRNWGNVPLGGGDGKRSILETEDRKMRRDVRQKADSAKSSYEGRKEYNDIDEKWNQGDKIKNKLASGGNSFSSFDGSSSSRGAYESVYKNKEFIDSLMNVDKADNEAKKMGKMYVQAQSYGGLDSIKAAGTDSEDAKYLLSKLTGDKFKSLASDADRLNAVTIADIYEINEKVQKSLKGVETVHDSMRKIHQEDAKTQDAIKFRKYNDKNPAQR